MKIYVFEKFMDKLDSIINFLDHIEKELKMLSPNMEALVQMVAETVGVEAIRSSGFNWY